MVNHPSMGHPPAVQASLDKWHAIVATMDMEALPSIVHPDAVFRSPMAHTPYKSAMALCMALNAVSQVFEGFTYHREYATADGMSATLEFSAMVKSEGGEGKQVKGADFIQFDEDGLITEFEVMIRPMSGLVALGEEMGKRVGAQLKEFK